MNDTTSKPAATKPAETPAPAADADDVRANAVAAMEEAESLEPFPSQADLNRIHRGEHLTYKTRQAKAG